MGSICIRRGPGATTSIPLPQDPEQTKLRNGLLSVDVDVELEIFTVESGIQPTLYQVYHSVNDISYTPENAFHDGIGMAKAMKAEIFDKLELGSSKLRKDVWLREIDSQGPPTTMIAVCGDNIVPTSGVRACTAVVTEIAYHAALTIDADVSFLSEAEWRDELAVLLDNLLDEVGKLRRTTDLGSDAGIAWHKVHAVYPSIAPQELIHMTVDQILARDTNIANILGITKKISAKNSTMFAQEIRIYIDSNDKRGDEKNKNTYSDNPLINTGAKKTNHDPVLWPLIRQVNVRCNAKALSTGAILVDLPGVADVNAARNSIAKDYMKKCDCIWILAPITRAVDDKTARGIGIKLGTCITILMVLELDLLGEAFKIQLMNGNYDAHTITFIGTKCDDVSCDEIIPAFYLEGNPELEEIKGRIELYKKETANLEEKKADAESRIKCTDVFFVPVTLNPSALTALHKQLHVHVRHTKYTIALENSELHVTGTVLQKAQSSGMKRQNTYIGNSGSQKRHKSSAVEDEDRDLEMSHIDGGGDHVYEGQELEKVGQERQEKGQDAQHDDEVEVTVEVLEVKMNDARKARKDAVHALSNIKVQAMEALREQNAFCSLKRSETPPPRSETQILLIQLRICANFYSDYDEIDLPVFTCSSRDYMRIVGRVKRDGGPSCFSNVKDTGIPALQEWCHQLTIGNRSRAAKRFHTQLTTFANSVRVYVDGIGDMTIADREALREKWESIPQDVQDLSLDNNEDPSVYSDDLDLPDSDVDDGQDSDDGYNSFLKVDAHGEPIGVTPRLVKEFGAHVEKLVSDLQGLFRDGLEDKCQVGADKAAEGAVQHVDEFARSMHWNSYRATLRRHGSWHRDLNVELLIPFTRNIASSWSTLFESDLFAPLSAAITECVNRLLVNVEATAVAALKDRVRAQSYDSQEEARLALGKIMEVVEKSLEQEQKQISRCLAPHVQAELADGYDLAIKERGIGSVARQKTLFHNYIDIYKDIIFDDGLAVLMRRLLVAAEAIGKALNKSLRELAEKVEVSLAVLWEDMPDDIIMRPQIFQSVSQVLEQLTMWSQAAERHYHRRLTHTTRNPNVFVIGALAVESQL
ncbi:hypothetical protein DFH29DRAFT_869853 [Suillus ampliporus]|nr:hypothetical protein DFH29DRAFT_869853 [Suillus ampliporus]